MSSALGIVRSVWRQGRFALARRLRRPVKERWQPYAFTLPDRYPWLFDYAATAVGDAPGARLLSFGCSGGDEVFSLHRRLPDAAIKGIDIDPRNIALAGARARASGFDALSFEAAASVRGEPADYYDAVFCLAVLVHGDLTITRARRCEPTVRFADFERTVDELARCVKPGGLLFLHTTNFRFCDTQTSHAFDAVLEALPEQMAPDAQFDREGEIMLGEAYRAVGFRKRSV